MPCWRSRTQIMTWSMRVSIRIPPVLGIVGLKRGCPLDDLAGLEHAGNVLGMLQDPDVVERVALDQDNVGPLARCEYPRAVLNADGLGSHPRGGHERFRWREAILREQFQLQRIRASHVERRATIRPHGNVDAHLMGATHAFLM